MNDTQRLAVALAACRAIAGHADACAADALDPAAEAELYESAVALARKALAQEQKPAPSAPRDLGKECPGHGHGGTGPPCCERAGEYNGFGSGPLIFVCPKSCGCHD